MKSGSVIKVDKRNAETPPKKIDGDAMSVNCGGFVIFRIYGQFGAIWKPNSWPMVCKTYIFIISNLLFYKKWKHN